MNRQAQIIGHVFIFMLGAFVVASVLLIGYKALNNMQEQQCRAQELEFARDVEQAFDTGLDRGTVQTHTFTLPCGASEVCFVQRSAIDTGNTMGKIAQPQYRIIASSVENKEPASIWVRGAEGYTKVDAFTRALPIADFPTTDPSLGLSEGLKCFLGDEVTVRFEGRGMSIWVRADE
jgi:hypothetical protein